MSSCGTTTRCLCSPRRVRLIRSLPPPLLLPAAFAIKHTQQEKPDTRGEGFYSVHSRRACVRLPGGCDVFSTGLPPCCRYTICTHFSAASCCITIRSPQRSDHLERRRGRRACDEIFNVDLRHHPLRTLGSEKPPTNRFFTQECLVSPWAAFFVLLRFSPPWECPAAGILFPGGSFDAPMRALTSIRLVFHDTSSAAFVVDVWCRCCCSC